MEKKNNKVLIIILVVIILCLLGFIVYDKFIKKAPEIKEKECQICEICQECEKCEVCQECEKCDDNKIECNCPASSVLGLKVSSVKKVTITKENQTFKIGNKKYKLRIGDEEILDEKYEDVLFIDDDSARIDGGGLVTFEEAYLTDQFMFFIHVAQDGAMLAYGFNNNGEVKVNNNEYQMSNFRIKDGYLHASGHIFCGLDGDCPDKDLIIKYVDNTLIVVPAK